MSSYSNTRVVLYRQACTRQVTERWWKLEVKLIWHVLRTALVNRCTGGEMVIRYRMTRSSTSSSHEMSTVLSLYALQVKTPECLYLKVKVSTTATANHMPYGVTVLPATRQRISRLYSQPKVILDLATLEGCKAELTWVVVISHNSLHVKYGHLSQK